jgi:hypothetical protein
MTSASLNKGLVLAVHPTSRGFGWVLFEGPLSAVDWGMASSKRGRNSRLVARFERLLTRYEPSVVVLEEFEGRRGRVDRIQRLCRSFVHLAACAGCETPVLRRALVQAVFVTAGAVTRYEIAQVIASRVPALAAKKPRKRAIWESESPRQSLFDAAALATAYFSLLQ